MPVAQKKTITRIRGTLKSAVERSVEHMPWLEKSDEALIALAIKYADEIDHAGDDQRAVGYTGAQLMAALRALGGTPAERRSLNIEGAVSGRLAELRKSRTDRERRAPGMDSSAEGADA